jgi:Fe-S cluster biogenesis protein NfuA/nitrite reductase/ring-hydroxylating ferredoxin subunit
MEFDKAVAELDALVRTLEREGDERALLLLELVDAIHRPALERIVRGEVDHPIARSVLAMYELAELDDAEQVESALDSVRPYVESHGGALELLGVDDGVVRVRMRGACVGCAGSSITLRRGVEAALREGYPGFRELVAEEGNGAAGAASPLLQIEGLTAGAGANGDEAPALRRPVFRPAGRAEELERGAIRALEVEGVPVLLVNPDGEVYAFRNACPLDKRPLDGGRLNGTVLVCPWHNCAYDARSGARVDERSDAGLAVVPIAFREGRIEVAVNVA